jgi:hypothetical protein
MASGTTYTWTINQMMVKPKFQDYSNFVCYINWNYNAVDANGNISTMIGTTGFDSIGEDFVDYQSLTPDIVSEWLDESNDLILLQNYLDQQIQNLINPPVINLGLPW